MSTRKWIHSTAFKSAATAIAASLVLFGSTAAASPAPRHASASGVTINVAIAYPAPPKAMLAKFTSQTGIKVNWSNVGWDDLQTKIAAAAAIFVCRSSHCRYDQLTLMPVWLVNLASIAFGGAG